MPWNEVSERTWGRTRPIVNILAWRKTKKEEERQVEGEGKGRRGGEKVASFYEGRKPTADERSPPDVHLPFSI